MRNNGFKNLNSKRCSQPDRISLPPQLYFFNSSDEHYKILHTQRNWVWKYTIYENADPELILVDSVAKVKLFCCSCWEYSMDKECFMGYTFTHSWDLGRTDQEHSVPVHSETQFQSWKYIYTYINVYIKIQNTMVYTHCRSSNALNSETATYLQGKILVSDECFLFLASKRQRCRTSHSMSRHNQNCYSEIKYLST